MPCGFLMYSCCDLYSFLAFATIFAPWAHPEISASWPPRVLTLCKSEKKDSELMKLAFSSGIIMIMITISIGVKGFYHNVTICSRAHDPPGSSWLLLAPPGSSWLLLGSSWLLLAAPGSSWLLLAPPGSSWLLLAPPGSSWLPLAPPGSSGSSGSSWHTSTTTTTNIHSHDHAHKHEHSIATTIHTKIHSRHDHSFTPRPFIRASIHATTIHTSIHSRHEHSRHDISIHTNMREHEHTRASSLISAVAAAAVARSSPGASQEQPRSIPGAAQELSARPDPARLPV